MEILMLIIVDCWNNNIQGKYKRKIKGIVIITILITLIMMMTKI